MEIIFAYISVGFFCCGGLWFLLGFLGILSRRRGVFVDRVWWIGWVRWFVGVLFLGGEFYADF
jgi:hypothetical protein